MEHQMLETHRQVAEHKGYKIFQRQPGFEFTPVMLAKVASHIAQHDDGRWTVFAFMYSLLATLDNSDIDEESLLDAAVDTIKAQIDAGKIAHRSEQTFEYRSESFIEVVSPRWWIPTHR